MRFRALTATRSPNTEEVHGNTQITHDARIPGNRPLPGNPRDPPPQLICVTVQIKMIKMFAAKGKGSADDAIIIIIIIPASVADPLQAVRKATDAPWLHSREEDRRTRPSLFRVLATRLSSTVMPAPKEPPQIPPLHGRGPRNKAVGEPGQILNSLQR